MLDGGWWMVEVLDLQHRSFCVCIEMQLNVCVLLSSIGVSCCDANPAPLLLFTSEQCRHKYKGRVELPLCLRLQTSVNLSISLRAQDQIEFCSGVSQDESERHWRILPFFLYLMQSYRCKRRYFPSDESGAVRCTVGMLRIHFRFKISSQQWEFADKYKEVRLP